MTGTAPRGGGRRRVVSALKDTTAFSYARKARGALMSLALRSDTMAAILGRAHLLRLEIPGSPPSAQDRPRWGYGSPSHARLSDILARGDGEYRGVLEGFAEYSDALHAIPLAQTDPREPHWLCGFLFGLDGVSLYSFIRERKPRRYMEIGSGNSTLFVDRARRDGAIDMQITSIDPRPRRDIDAICDRVIREPLEVADLGIFSELEAGDVVFMDGTHRVFMNSDAVVFFMDVLADLPPGVLVGVHDIHLPDDYRPVETKRYYSEQYLLAAYLLAEADWLRPVLPCWYISHHQALGDLSRSLAPAAIEGRGLIFWMQTEQRGERSR